MTGFHEKASSLIVLITFLIFTLFVSRYCATGDGYSKKLKDRWTREYSEQARYHEENYIRKTQPRYEFREKDVDEVKDSGEFSSGEYAVGVREKNKNRAKRYANPFMQNQRVAEAVDDNKTARANLAKKSRNKLYSWENKVERRETGWSMHTDENRLGRVKRAGTLPYPDRNSTDYYERRKAVMQRFYARQREIAEKYKKTLSSSPRPFFLDINGHVNATPKPYDTFLQDKKETTTTPITLDNGNSKIAWTNRDTNSLTGGLSAESNNVNAENNTAVKLPEEFSPKHQKKRITEDNDDHGYDDDDEEYDDDDDDASSYNQRSSRLSAMDNNDIQRWGICTGTVVYQHNLLLGLRGPSNLNAIFEVIIQQSVCITCVEVHRYNRTRATVTLNTGGRGFEFAKLKLQGYENEGFSYIIKVWAVKKVQQDCKAQLASSR